MRNPQCPRKHPSMYAIVSILYECHYPLGSPEYALVIPNRVLYCKKTILSLLRKILEWRFPAAREQVLDNPPYSFYTALTEGESNNRANNNAKQTTKRNSLKEHAIAKKCHHCHLFNVTAGIQLFLLHSKGVQGDNIPFLVGQICG